MRFILIFVTWLLAIDRGILEFIRVHPIKCLILTIVKGSNFLQELDLDWFTWLIINLGTIFKIAWIIYEVAAREMKLQLISSFTVLNPFSTNVPLIDKPGSGFYQQNVSLPQVFLKHFASKNQLPGLSISGTVVEEGLISICKTNPL